MPMLTPVEARVLGCLMEKQRTTPNNYPLTLNALVQACNQKTGREPVMNLDVGEIGHTVNLLRDRGLIKVGGLGRTERYHHSLAQKLELNAQEQAIMCVLILRSAQTANEIRTHSARLAEFASLAELEEKLDGLVHREPALIVKWPRGEGRREERYAQLLCGDVKPESWPSGQKSRVAAEQDRMLALQQEVSNLRAEVDKLWVLTGLAGQKPADSADDTG
jgi:uncharacterized protein YceH (UPF0502 family)